MNLHGIFLCLQSLKGKKKYGVLVLKKTIGQSGLIFQVKNNGC